MTLQAYRYGGFTYVKFGRKATPGPMYTEDDIISCNRPPLELWRDGTVTFHDRPEGDISMMRKVRLPAWAYLRPIKRYRSRG